MTLVVAKGFYNDKGITFTTLSVGLELKLPSRIKIGNRINIMISIAILLVKFVFLNP